jgi:hypothetical protein
MTYKLVCEIPCSPLYVIIALRMSLCQTHYLPCPCTNKVTSSKYVINIKFPVINNELNILCPVTTVIVHDLNFQTLYQEQLRKNENYSLRWYYQVFISNL